MFNSSHKAKYVRSLRPLSKDEKYIKLLKDSTTHDYSKEEIDGLIQEANECFIKNRFDEPLPHWMVRRIAEAKKFAAGEVNALKGLAVLCRSGLKIRFEHQRVDSLLLIASKKNHKKLVQFLVEEFNLILAHDEPHHPLAMEGLSDELFNYLSEKISTYSSDTVFTMAARYSSISLMTRFLSMGYTHINEKDKRGLTPIMYAVLNAQSDMLDFLLSVGANIHTKNNKGQTVAHIIFHSCEPSWVLSCLSLEKYNSLWSSMLLGSDAYRDNEGLLPIHYAIFSGHTELVEYLLERAPSLIDVVDANGRTLLFNAVIANQLPILQRLHHKYGLSLRVRDKFNKALIDMCQGEGALDIPNWLKSMQSVILNHSDLAITPLYFAITSNNMQMIRWILSQPELDLSARFSPGSSREHGNDWTMLHLLVDYMMFDIIIEFDLFNKHKTLLLRQAENETTCLDLFYVKGLSLEQDSILRDKISSFMRYVLKNLPNWLGSKLPILSYYKSSIVMIEFCLDHFILQIDDLINDGEPIFHALEADIDRKNKEQWGELKRDLAIYSFEHTLEYMKNDLYTNYMRKVVDKYSPNLNVRDRHGLHLLAKLIKLGAYGALRIQWLCDNIPSIKVTDLDLKESSLLHLAAEMQDIQMMTWCVRKGLSVTTKRRDGKNSLDISLLLEHYDGAEFLFKQLSDKSRRNYLRGLANLNQSELIGLLHNNAFFGWQPTLKQFNELPECMRASFPELQKQVLANSEKDIVVEVVDIDLPKTMPVDSPIEVEEAVVFDFDEIQLQQAIIQNNVSWIRSLKRACNENEAHALKLKAMVEGAFFEFICSSMGEKRHKILYQLLRMPVLQGLVRANIDNFLPYIIKRGQMRTLFLFLKQKGAVNTLSLQGFDLLSLALNEGHLQLFMMLLSHPCVKLRAHESDNQLLRLAAKNGHAEIVKSLLEVDAVSRLAGICKNEALRHAASNEDEESCFRLLQVPNVISALSEDNYAIVRDAIDLHQEVFFQMMLQIADVQRFIKETPHYMHLIGRFDLIQDFTEFQIIEPSYIYSPAYFEAMQRTHDVFTATLNGDIPALCFLFSNQGSIDPQLIKELVLFALNNRQNHVLYWLIETDTLCAIKSHLGFCNLLIKQALWLGAEPQVLDYLLSLEPAGTHLSLYNNRLLMTAIRHQRPEIALKLLDNARVFEMASMMNNYALRHAAQRGYIEVVARLLQVADVREYIAIINHEAFRRAFSNGHLAVVHCLLRFDVVFDYALAKGEIYINAIISFVKKTLSDWRDDRMVIDQEKGHFLSKIKQVEFIYSNHDIQLLEAQLCVIKKQEPLLPNVTNALMQLSIYSPANGEQEGAPNQCIAASSVISDVRLI